MKVRRANHSDEAAIERIHTDTWIRSYREIIPDAHLNKLIHYPRFIFWLDSLKETDSRIFIYVAENGSAEVVGFAAVGPSTASHLAYEAELYAIYVLPEQHGMGTGRRLLNATARELLTQNRRSMLLHVLKENPSRQFYERLGGHVLEEKQVEVEGVAYDAVIYGWSDVGRLVQDVP